MLWLQFLISSALILFAGVKLTVYADALSSRMNLGKVLIGVILLGFVTSLPEAVSSLTAVVALHANDLAIGNVIGSNCFNPMLIVVMDLIHRRGPVTDQIGFSRVHNIPGIFAVIMTAIVAAEIFFSRTARIPEWFHVSLGSWMIFVVYWMGMKELAGSQVNGPVDMVEEELPRSREESLGKIVCYLIFSSVLVVGAGVWLANISNRLADLTGWGETVVGSTFLAVVTSLPEMVVTISALKMGGFGLAMGNIFGSNMTNMLITGLCDFFYREGPVLETVSEKHVLTAGLSIVLTGIAYSGIRFKNKRKFILAWDTALMTAVYFAGMGMMALYR